MNQNAIGENIRNFRKSRHWTQEELAAVSGVDVRTIQRAEAGHPLSVESLRALAAAFDTTVDVLSSSFEDVRRSLEEFDKKYRLVHLQAIDGADLQGLVSQSNAFQLQRVGDLSSEQLDSIAELEQDLKDYLDLWNDLEPIQRREAEKDLRSRFAEVASRGIAVSVGQENVAMRFPNNGAPFRMTVLHLVAVSGTVPLPVLAREKAIPISFA